MQMTPINLEGLMPRMQGASKAPAAVGAASFLEQFQAMVAGQGNDRPAGMEALFAMLGGQGTGIEALPPELMTLDQGTLAETPGQLAALLEELAELPAGALQVAGLVQTSAAAAQPEAEGVAEPTVLKPVAPQPGTVLSGKELAELEAVIAETNQPAPQASRGEAAATAVLAEKPASPAFGQSPVLDAQAATLNQAQHEGEKERKGKESLSDSRFAQMLGVNKPASATTAAAGHQGETRPVAGVQQAPIAVTAETSVEAAVAETVGRHEQPVEAAPAKTAQGFEQELSLQGSRTTQGASTADFDGQEPVLKLASGKSVTESQILEQLASRITFNQTEKQSRMTLRLHPEELGQVKLELVMDKEGLRAHLQAQNPQVQEVLERHLPRLREALAQQGLRLDDLQVSVDSQDRGDRGFFQQQQQSAFARRPAYSAGTANFAAPVEEVAAAPRAAQAQGLSLRI